MTSAPAMPATTPPVPAARPARSRLRGLDGLRFIAAAAVVGYHYSGIKTAFWGTAPANVFPKLNEVTRYGYLGVEFFFIISGFVILMTAYGRSVQGFAASRVARLFPAYWVAVVITFVLQAFWDAGRSPDWLTGAINLTMIQDAFDVGSVQGAFWTLWIELKFYLLMGVFILVGFNDRRIIAFAVLWPVVAQIARATGSTFLSSLLIPEYAPYFALGMLLFLVYRRGSSLVVWLGVGFDLILCLEQAYNHAPAVTRLVTREVSGNVACVAVVVMVALIWLVSAGPLRHIEWRWLSVLGALTYPLYLIHGQFGFFVIDQLHGALNGYAVLAIAVALALALAVALHYLVERTLHDRVRDGVLRGLEDPLGDVPPRTSATRAARGRRAR